MTYKKLIKWAIDNNACIEGIARAYEVSSLKDLKYVLESSDWRWLLRRKPELHVYCDFSKIDGYDWHLLLIQQPQFAEHCDWNKLDGSHWSYLLKYEPKFANKCDWSKLTGYDWSWLLESQPQLKKYQIK